MLNNITWLLILILIKLILAYNTLNRFFEIKDLNYRYINLATNSDGDLILEATKYPNGDAIRKFISIDSNGNFPFKDDNGDPTPYFSLTASGQVNPNQNRFEAEILFIKISKINSINTNDDIDYDKEYLTSIGYTNSYTEIYDFDKKTIIGQKQSINFLSYKIESDSFAFFQQKFLTDKNYYIVAYISVSSNGYYFNINRFYITSTDIENNNFVLENKIHVTSTYRNIVSCFETLLGKIICFYQDNSFRFTIQQYNYNLEEENIKLYLATETNGETYQTYIFSKGIQLKNEIGIFAYYESYSATSPHISIKIFENSQINDYNNIKKFTLNQASMTYYYKLNDLIKINDKNICYAACSVDKKILNIIIITLLNKDTEVFIKYYSINMFSL